MVLPWCRSANSAYRCPGGGVGASRRVDRTMDCRGLGVAGRYAFAASGKPSADVDEKLFEADDHVDAAGPDLAEQPLQRRSFHRSAREAAIVVAGRQAAPAFMGLTLDVGLGCLALVVERVELLLEPVLG